MREAPLFEGAFLFLRHPASGRHRGPGTGDGGGVVSGGIPSYNFSVMTETLLKPTNSLDALLERLPPEPHLRGEEFERAAK